MKIFTSIMRTYTATIEISYDSEEDLGTEQQNIIAEEMAQDIKTTLSQAYFDGVDGVISVKPK